MPYKSRIVVILVVLITLALASGPAGAQEVPVSPAVGVCLAGTGYASGCDVDQDGDIDINDVQRTAGRWNSNGPYTPGHTHWGETWSGAAGTPGLVVEHTNGSGSFRALVGRTAADYGVGVVGDATATTGLPIGVLGQSASVGGVGVLGEATAASGDTYGVQGFSASSAGRGVYGQALAASGVTYGVQGVSNSSAGRGVYGWATTTSGITYGVYGRSESTEGAGLFGLASAESGETVGVWGQANSTSGTGVFGRAAANSGYAYGVYGQNISSSGTGVYGEATASSGVTYGVMGVSASSNGYGGYFLGNGPEALYVQNTASGRAVQAYAPSDTAVWAKTDSGFAGVDAWNSSTSGRGVSGWASAPTGNTHGVWGQSASTSGTGVLGWASAASGDTTGVYGESVSPDGQGVFGVAAASSGTNYGVYGWSNSPGGYAGYFDGQVQVTGILSKGGGAFKIDHPLDPANQYLYHSFVESPDMKNIYDGVAILDDDGAAVVTLPAWFEALNRDFRYQLTPIGGWAPLYIAQKIKDNTFQIAGGEPGMEVSWMVTGIRQDAFANAHRIPVEAPKPAGERGLYLHPTELGQPKEMGLDYARGSGRPALRQEVASGPGRGNPSVTSGGR